MPELDLGNAERDVVLSAWRLHMTLFENAKVMNWWANLMFASSTFLVVITSLLSVSSGWLPTTGEALFQEGELTPMLMDYGIVVFLARSTGTGPLRAANSWSCIRLSAQPTMRKLTGNILL